jgi:hypothetical protein
MTVGFEAYNDSGYVQITPEMKNFVFKAKGSGTCTTNIGSSVAIYVATINITSNGFPIFAINSSGLCGIIGATVSGSTWSIYVASNTSGATFDWWQFDEPDAGASPENQGLELFKSDGSRGWHSSLNAMRIVDVVDANHADVTYTSGHTYAACQTASGWRFTETAGTGKGGLGSYKALMASCSFSGATIHVPWASIFTGLVISNFTSTGLIDDSYLPPTPKFIVLDVTGL